MLKINAYITRQLLIGTILVTVGLACILWLTQSLRFVELIIKKGLSVGSFVYLTMLLLPNFLVIIMPIAMFAVVLFTYNRLAADRELVVLRSAGVSNWGLSKPAIGLALALVTIGYSLTLYAVPKSVEQFREMQWSIRTDVSRVLLKEGVFTPIATGVTVYVRSRTEDGELLGILVHDKRNPKKLVTMMAERGALVNTGSSPRVLMVNGNRQEVVPGTGRLSLLYFDSYTVELGGLGGEEGVRFRDARERSLLELFTLTEKDDIGEGGHLSSMDVRRFRVEGHQRLVSPMYFMAYTVIALACLLTGGFNRRGQAGKILLAIGLMIMVQASALGVSNLTTNRLSLVFLVYLNALVPFAVGVFVLLRTPRRRLKGTAGFAPVGAG